MLKAKKIAFIGSGNMAEAMISGMLKQRLVRAQQITAAGPRPERGQQMHKRYGIKVTTHNVTAVKTADVIVLSVKPQTMAKVLGELRGVIPGEALVISIAAGVRLEAIHVGLSHGNVVRAMPNTPGKINQGITVWTSLPEVSETQRAQAGAILQALGEEQYVETELFVDMATAVSGTGPTYLYLVMEAWVDGAVQIGLPRWLAEKLVRKTVAGSCAYWEQNGDHLAKLRNDVTSPGGTSAAALSKLEEAGVRSAFLNAIQAAFDRCLQLGGVAQK